MNKKRNMDSGRKSARPDYIQKTISKVQENAVEKFSSPKPS